MIGAVDIGNTNITFGLIHDSHVIHSWRLSTAANRTADEFFLVFDQLIHSIQISAADLHGIAISSVVPDQSEPVNISTRMLCGKEPFIVRPGIRIDMKIHYDKPQNLGADRLVNAYAAKKRYGFPVIVIDMGTATTISVIDGEGHFQGGMICPGVKAMYDTLHHSTSLLPRLPFSQPEHLIGHSTVSCIQSGVFWGYCALIEGLVTRIQHMISGNPVLVATGGIGYQIVPFLKTIHHFEPELILIGLEQLFYLNQNCDPSCVTW